MNYERLTAAINQRDKISQPVSLGKAFNSVDKYGLSPVMTSG